MTPAGHRRRRHVLALLSSAACRLLHAAAEQRQVEWQRPLAAREDHLRVAGARLKADGRE
jgi:hypothetical protein